MTAFPKQCIISFSNDSYST
uniref:Uncharacterized protein n=1 Tax=Anguilla anguilla TaxID=7936 RepID=A0A0E9SBM4_ANGAN